jgi:hypothetical protein
LVVGLLLAAAACRSPAGRGGDASAALTGAPAPRAAVERFMAAVSAQDLQALSTVWGNKDGPARDAMSRDELEKRELLMMCYLTHDRFRIVGEEPGMGGRLGLRVEVTRGNLTRETSFLTVRGPAGRWYVENADLTNMQAFCQREGER